MIESNSDQVALKLNASNFLNNVGGASRDRTDDLLRAKQALSQLSYSPILRTQLIGGPAWTRTTDLILIRDAL